MNNNILNEKILLVDDEEDITGLIEEALRQEGFQDIDIAHTGLDAVKKCRTNKPSLVVLDVMLPDIDGIEVCRQLRSFTYCPILFLSAKGDDLDKIIGLGCGGDDYITKPFSVKELIFRIKAQFRREQYHASDIEKDISQPIYVGNLVLDSQACTVTKDGQLIDLTAREFKMLQFLFQNKNRILSKERLYEAVWGELSAVCDNTIMVHIRHLREKIEDDPSHPVVLVTVKGLGYKLIDQRGGEV